MSETEQSPEARRAKVIEEHMEAFVKSDPFTMVATDEFRELGITYKEMMAAIEAKFKTDPDLLRKWREEAIAARKAARKDKS